MQSRTAVKVASQLSEEELQEERKTCRLAKDNLAKVIASLEEQVKDLQQAISRKRQALVCFSPTLHRRNSTANM